MVEDWAKQILADDWNVYFAGIETRGVNPRVIEAMKEVGTGMPNRTSDLIDNNIIKNSNLAVTLCSDADANYPSLPTNVEKEHWGLDDPVDKPWLGFQRVRDEIKIVIENFKSR